ncbi:hypothetical protein Purlil1_14210 [Purpureocillium lilacinum]|uniref:Uncharacterized protein n=1 Tax=Purpureocillium lilacinum TaxID=33203 RepID=A0ABR0BBW8_PURLI|nr:hypothetical protein Purlil1_14210 [Purpureocillium lilacinum]
MISFESLVSLTLRNCPGWDTFLARAARLKCRIQLTTFELHSETVSPLWTQNTLVEFLGAFRGLEELFVSQAGPVDSLALWDCIACHESTLKRLVQQQSAINTEMMAPYFEGAHIIWDPAIFGRSARDMRDDPCQSPFAQLDLEYVGIGYAPERLKYALLPFRYKNTLKVLHIRQSTSDLRSYPSWALVPSRSGSRAGSSFLSGSGRVLRTHFRQFAEWVFGPEGITSMWVVVFGDFSYGGRKPQDNLVLCRDTAGGTGFRLLQVEDKEWIEDAALDVAQGTGTCGIQGQR